MSRLVLIRHGQARAFEEHSDRLSARGLEQAQRLGQWFGERGTRFDEVYCGTLERQRRTAELMGLEFSEDARWNEYDAGGVMTKLGPLLAERDAGFAMAVELSRRHRQTTEANRYFQRMFEQLIGQWAAGELNHPEVESWAAFQQRVRDALHALIAAEGEGRNVLVVTSGGPIATVVQTVVQAPPRMAIELNWRVKNCSATEFLFSKERITLDSFNGVSHLPAEWVTYR
ncbi:MAG: histidine phosphatase family protein [Acidobacteria bacterium]|nr:histidine phosphatase family protein [Acidobacteriota bacterium]